jgi:hypothetical protein
MIYYCTGSKARLRIPPEKGHTAEKRARLKQAAEKFGTGHERPYLRG